MRFHGDVTTYYRDSSVRVTTDAVSVEDRTWPVREITYVWHSRGQVDRRVAGRVALRLGLIGLLALPFAVRLAVSAHLWSSDRSLPHKLGTAAALTVVSLSVLALLVPLLEVILSGVDRSYDRTMAVREIWVRCRGREELLLRTSDVARFRRVYRAIERAVAADAGSGTRR